MMQLPFDGSVPVSPLYVPCTGPAPMLALASASPENQRLNLSLAITYENLKKLFASLSTITSAVVMRDANGESRGFGLDNFESADVGAAAIEKMDGETVDNKVLYDGRAQWKVMLNEQGLSKGSGFVAFSSPEEATKALHEMIRKMIGWKPLYVAAHFAQIRAPGAFTPPASGIPGFHHDGPRLPQQLYFGQGSPSIIPRQPAGFGFQQQLLPEMRPGLLHRNSNQGGRYMSNRRNGVDSFAVPQGLAMMQLPFDGSMPVSPLDVLRTGAQLFPLVNLLEPDYAAKMTGMLLELDQKTEVLHLIESPYALKDKVAEAMEVLCKASSNDVYDQLGSLS
ncbi:hypothetical protein UlMin_027438 [Ulmus minor]